MRVFFFAAYFANLALAYALIHLQPSRTLARHGFWPVLTLIALYTLLLAAILLAPRLVRCCPARWVGIPHADYWLQAENRGQAVQKLQARLLAFGAVTFLILLLAGILVLRFQQAPQVQPEWWKLRVAAMSFLIYSAYWCLGLLRDFRVPEKGRVAAASAGG